MRFTDIAIKSLKPESKKYYRREANGFTVRVMPSGVKTWLYVYTFEGKRKEMNLGQYPHVSLADARTKFNAALELFKNGKNPGELAKQEQEDRRSAPTIDDLVKDFLDKWVKKTKVDRSIYDDTRTLQRDVLPKWGKRKAADIRRRDAIELLEEIAERAPGQARNVLKVARKMFSFALQREIVEVNPFTMITGSVPELAPGKRERVLSTDEIKLLWEKLEAPDISGGDEIRRCLKLILVTGQRPGEVAGMHRQEVDGRWWTIPSERVKTRREHRVYLTDTALHLLGSSEDFIFQAPKKKSDPDKKSPITVNSLAHALRRNFTFPLFNGKGKPILGEGGKQQTENRLGVEHFTPHDLRRTVRTQLAEMGVSREWCEALLNHTLPGVEGIYNRHKYEMEIRHTLELWEKRLKSIINPKPGQVIPIRKRS